MFNTSPYESCQGLLVNWQKSFGLELITSDEFHANIGIFTNICNGACRILWGLLYDRIGYRKCFLIIGTFVSVGVTSLPLLKYLGEDRNFYKFIYVTLELYLLSRGEQHRSENPVECPHGDLVLHDSRNIRCESAWSIDYSQLETLF